MKKTIRESVWDWFRHRTPHSARRWFKRQKWFNPVAQVVFGDKVYSQSYYDSIEKIEAASVVVMGEWIASHLRPARAVDIGCGPGHLMAALAAHGVSIFGVDIADAAIRKLADKGLAGQQFDLTGPDPIPGGPYDLAICCEVAEHLRPEFAGGLVAKLVAAAPVVFLTAAEPDPEQGPGLYHFNERPNDYWIGLLSEAGMTFDRPTTTAARTAFATADVIRYLAKPMIFRRG